MSNVIATGPTMLAIERVAHLVALSGVFQNGRGWKPAYDESVKLVMLEADDDEQSPVRPNAVVDVDRPTTWSMVSGGGSNLLRPSGAVSLILEVDWNPNYYDDFRNALTVALNYFEGIVAEIANNAGRDISPDLGLEFADESGDLNINEITFDAISRSDPDKSQESDWFFRAKVTISWGDRVT